MIFFALYQEANPTAPKTDAAPSFLAFRDRFGAARPAPVIRNLGGGCYGFDATPNDEAAGCGFLIDAGISSSPRYSYGTIGNAAVFLVVFDDTGAPLASATPAIVSYKLPSGADSTPIPTISNLTGGLYAFTPSDSDRVLGVAFEGDVGAANSLNRRFSGVVSDGVITATPINSSASSATKSTTAAPKVRDLAFNFKTKKFELEGGDLSLTQDIEAIRQAVQIKCQTFLGECFLDLDAGIPYFQNVLVKSPNTTAISQIFRDKIESVPGVVSVTRLDLTIDRQQRSLSLSFAANTDLGEISGTITPPSI